MLADLGKGQKEEKGLASPKENIDQSIVAFVAYQIKYSETVCPFRASFRRKFIALTQFQKQSKGAF